MNTGIDVPWFQHEEICLLVRGIGNEMGLSWGRLFVVMEVGPGRYQDRGNSLLEERVVLESILG